MRGCRLAESAGADFVKTSTGFRTGWRDARGPGAAAPDRSGTACRSRRPRRSHARRPAGGDGARRHAIGATQTKPILDEYRSRRAGAASGGVDRQPGRAEPDATRRRRRARRRLRRRSDSAQRKTGPAVHAGAGSSGRRSQGSMNVFRRSRAITASLGMAILVAGCTGGDCGDGAYTMGVSNTLTGNGWREEMICSINARLPCPRGRLAQRQPPRHGRRGSARGHPQPHLRGRGRDHREPSRPLGHRRRAGRGDRGGHHGRAVDQA